jgi:hypothetical protein
MLFEEGKCMEGLGALSRKSKGIKQYLQIPIAIPEFAASKELDRDRLAL